MWFWASDIEIWGFLGFYEEWISCDHWLWQYFFASFQPYFSIIQQKLFKEKNLLYWECVATRNASKTVNDSSCRALQVNWLQVSIRVGKKICKKTKITKIQFQLKNLFLNKQSHNFGKNISKIPWNWFDLFSKFFLASTFCNFLAYYLVYLMQTSFLFF